MAGLPPSPMQLRGGCLCRGVTYTISIPALEDRGIAEGVSTYRDRKSIPGPTRWPLISFDHCTSCRVATGGLIVGWITLPAAWITFHLMLMTTGHEKRDYGAADVTVPSAEVKRYTTVKEYRSSPDVTRTFCGECGTTLTYIWESTADMVDITLGSLDKESLVAEGVRADRHDWWRDRVEWIGNVLTRGDGGIGIHAEGSGNDPVAL